MELPVVFCSGCLGFQSSSTSFTFYFNLLERKQVVFNLSLYNFQLPEGSTLSINLDPIYPHCDGDLL